MGLCTSNVAEMREDMHGSLPHVNGIKQHFAAMPYAEMPEFIRQLRALQLQGEALSPSVIEFIVLTAARENEVCGMQWGEVDWAERVWALPAVRSKVGREHRTPLSDRALELLTRQRETAEDGEYVWPGRAGDGPVTGKSVYVYLTRTMGFKATIHGMRSAFRDWAGDETHFPRNDIENVCHIRSATP
jgi:integrase